MIIYFHVISLFTECDISARTLIQFDTQMTVNLTKQFLLLPVVVPNISSIILL